MRTMITDYGSELKITEHIILKNHWEYYVIDEDTGDPNIKLCMVMGFETEIGDVYMPEIEPYILTRTTDLEELAPAEGCRWADTKDE